MMYIPVEKKLGGKQMKRNTVIWKKSVSDNNYMCRCGNILQESNKMIGIYEPNSDIYERGTLCCNKCNHVVAKKIC